MSVLTTIFNWLGLLSYFRSSLSPKSLHIHVTSLKRILSFIFCWCRLNLLCFTCFTNICNLFSHRKSNQRVMFLLSIPTREMKQLTELSWYFVYPLVIVRLILLAVISLVIWLPKTEFSESRLYCLQLFLWCHNSWLHCWIVCYVPAIFR